MSIKSILRFVAVATLVAPLSFAYAGGKAHKLVFQVSSDDEGTMNLTLNNVANVEKNMHDAGEEVTIEVVAYGPGLNMYRDDKSPEKVKERIKSFAENYDNLTFNACANTKTNMEKKEGKEITLISQAKMVPAGVIHIMTRQEEGWSYIKP